jgi:hypothetical protein
VLVLDERHQVHVVLAPDDEDALAGVTVRIRMVKDVEQVAALDVEDDLLEPDAALRPDAAYPSAFSSGAMSTSRTASSPNSGLSSRPKSKPPNGLAITAGF